MGWKAGDLGRFRAEDPKRPRFEVIRGVKGQGVQVWYAGSSRTTIIPPDTFKDDCVDWWEVSPVPSDVPDWVATGVVFEIGLRTDPPKIRVMAAEIKRLWGDRSYGPDKLHIELDDQRLQIRSIRRDYVSCLVQPKGVLAIVSLQEVVARGYRSRTIWDRLSEDEDPYEDEAEAEAELIRLLDDA